MRRFHLAMLTAVFLLPAVHNHAQATRVMHETYLLDSVQAVTVQLYDAYQVQFWEGDKAMLKTSVRLYGAKDNILDHFIREGRYNVRDTVLAGQLQLVSTDQERATIRAAEGECFEQVELILYLPEAFEPAGEHAWRRKEGE